MNITASPKMCKAQIAKHKEPPEVHGSSNRCIDFGILHPTCCVTRARRYAHTGSDRTAKHLHAVRLSDDTVRYLRFETRLLLDYSGQSTASFEPRLYILFQVSMAGTNLKDWLCSELSSDVINRTCSGQELGVR